MPGTMPAPAVLLVEDNEAMRALIRSLVEDIASSVHECADGKSAVDLYARLHPDWVLMDIAMAGMDGIAATRAIRDGDPAARIIIITEQRDPAYRRKAMAAGARGFVLKEDLLDLPGLLSGLAADAPGGEETP